MSNNEEITKITLQTGMFLQKNISPHCDTHTRNIFPDCGKCNSFDPFVNAMMH